MSSRKWSLSSPFGGQTGNKGGHCQWSSFLHRCPLVRTPALCAQERLLCYLRGCQHFGQRNGRRRGRRVTGTIGVSTHDTRTERQGRVQHWRSPEDRTCLGAATTKRLLAMTQACYYHHYSGSKSRFDEKITKFSSRNRVRHGQLELRWELTREVTDFSVTSTTCVCTLRGVSIHAMTFPVSKNFKTLYLCTARSWTVLKQIKKSGLLFCSRRFFIFF